MYRWNRVSFCGKCVAALVLLPMLAQAAPVRRDDHGRIYRSRAMVRQFQHMTVCPITRLTGRCTGMIVDHRVPLLCAKTESDRLRLDHPDNMQYQTPAESRAKDRIEGRFCKVSI